MAKISDIYAVLNDVFPFSSAEKWDNSGYLVESDCDVKKVIVSLDATCVVVNEAIEKKAELIVCHHPVIFSALSSLSLKNPAVLALKNSIGIISAHTNYDVSNLGADALLEKKLECELGFCDVKLLDATDFIEESGFGRIGTLKTPLKSRELAAKLVKIFETDCMRFTPCEKEISKIAFCCGGGSSYVEKAISLGCDAYITSDVKHSHFISAKNADMALYAPTHYQMEKAAMQNMANLLSSSFPELEIILSESECEPSTTIK